MRGGIVIDCSIRADAPGKDRKEEVRVVRVMKERGTLRTNVVSNGYARSTRSGMAVSVRLVLVP